MLIDSLSNSLLLIPEAIMMLRHFSGPVLIVRRLRDSMMGGGSLSLEQVRLLCAPAVCACCAPAVRLLCACCAPALHLLCAHAVSAVTTLRSCADADATSALSRTALATC